MKRLTRSRKNKVFAGVCGGIGEYFEIDPVIVRIATVLLTIFGGLPILLYIIAIFIIPQESLENSAAEGFAKTMNPVSPTVVDPAVQESERARMSEHVRILGILYLALSALGIIAAAIIFSIIFGTTMFIHDYEANFVIRIVGLAIAGFLVLLSAPGFFTGFGLLKKEPWGRMMGLILGFVNLLNVPFGTALGVYSIWVLTHSSTLELFKQE